ncbi:sigma 54-interacting transcriptional regulator [Alkalicoccus halolimnae]|uniref:Sigma 54-interacting transcriptional regulator n=1 Tax=Alkalicoccus halolimnae TaxID=1667239 RepID=A0A5C7F938_9BACI|nr:sigma 54-interacting transcriptional regulator [Alkalicoccus halolimnae]TXF86120.1 AAA family ATPase [Alkalicoccus halolimnae]
MHKQLLLVTGNNNTKAVLHAQLNMLLGDTISIRSIAVDEKQQNFRPDEFQIILFSSRSVREEFFQLYAFPLEQTHLLTGKRTINPEAFPRLLALPKSRVLVVNDDEESVNETAESIYQLGIDHLELIPFQTGRHFYDGVTTAVTPSEKDRCPPSISRIIDIDVRPFDMTTIIRVVDYLKLDETIASKLSERYLTKMVKLQESLLAKEDHTQKISDHYHELLNQMDDAILAFNHKGVITAVNQGMEKILSKAASIVIGSSIYEVISNRTLLQFIENKDTRGFLTIGEQEHVLYKTTTSSFSSTVVTVKSVEKAFEIEQTARREHRRKGLASKYTLQDIIGEHPLLTEAKDRSLKMAAADYPVLIYGETGVGKELFAHAVHHNSKQWQGPFFAVNCSAMSESLLHSELFGYEEGTFTGALKGGKRGLFELASGGTLFLDEIGELSTGVQAQLLRVLQEGEIRRIGGGSNIPVENRIIAATNKNLELEVREGRFRSDLFYRLNVLHFSVPPLRERKSDLPLLCKALLRENRKLSPEAEDILQKYDWPGNIRELKSTIAYAETTGGNVLTSGDLPEFFRKMRPRNAAPLTPDLFKLLDLLAEAASKGERVSLKKLAEKASADGYSLSIQQVRMRIQKLAEKGFVEKGSGRMGSTITTQGLSRLQEL